MGKQMVAATLSRKCYECMNWKWAPSGPDKAFDIIHWMADVNQFYDQRKTNPNCTNNTILKTVNSDVYKYEYWKQNINNI